MAPLSNLVYNDSTATTLTFGVDKYPDPNYSNRIYLSLVQITVATPLSSANCTISVNGVVISNLNLTSVGGFDISNTSFVNFDIPKGGYYKLTDISANGGSIIINYLNEMPLK